MFQIFKLLYLYPLAISLLGSFLIEFYTKIIQGVDINDFNEEDFNGMDLYNLAIISSFIPIMNIVLSLNYSVSFILYIFKK